VTIAQATPTLICVAPNGARKLKHDHPAIPITPAELARDARACADAGAGLYHIHVRDDQGGHSLDPDRYRAALDAIHGAIGDRMILQITTEAVGIYDVATQMATVRAVVPPAASFALREFFPEHFDEGILRDFFGWVADVGVVPQFILYTPDEVSRLRSLIATGVIPFDNPPVLFVLGRYDDGPESDPAGITAFLKAWRDDGHWTICAFGPGEIAVAATALALGGNARIGFENNMSRPDGTPLGGNSEQVAHVAAIARALQRPLVTHIPERHRRTAGETVNGALG